MASFSKIFDNLKTSIYNKYSENPAKLLVFTGTLGWFLSCAAQVGAVVFNEKLSSKDKQFLIPQEMADGAVNVGLFFGITQGLHKYTDKMVETGKIMFSSMKKPLEDALTKKNQTLSEALKTNGGKISNILTGDAAKQNFIKLKGGTTLAMALLGSIVSCNILTPIIRNEIGARWQKRLSENKTSKRLNIISKSNELYPTQPLARPLERKINNPFTNNQVYSSSNLKI